MISDIYVGDASNIPECSEDPSEEMFFTNDEDTSNKLPRVEPSRPLTDFATSKASDGNSQYADPNLATDLEVIEESMDVVDMVDMKGGSLARAAGGQVVQERETMMLEHEIDQMRQDLGLEEGEHELVDEEVKQMDVRR